MKNFQTLQAELNITKLSKRGPQHSRNFQPHSEDSICQLLPNTIDGFPQIENQEWDQASRWQSQNNHVPNKRPSSDRHQEGIFEEYHFPLHWDAPESYCDPPHAEELYIYPPHE